MLKNFEKITEDLTDFEIKFVLPMLEKGLHKYVGKANAITNQKICDAVNSKGILGDYKLNPIRVRKIISKMRMLGRPMYLCSGQKGYYIAANAQEFDACIESLDQRINQQTNVLNALLWQRKELKL